MIKAVIFDCFGVLVVEAWVPLRNRLFSHNTLLMDEANDNMKRLSLGVITTQEFADAIAAMSTISSDEVIDQMHRNPLNDDLFIYIKKIRSQYKLAILSNVGANRIIELLGKDNMELFDAIGLSFDMGVAKPDARAYTMIAEQLKLLPEECVFTDDQSRFVEGAVDVGMQGIVFDITDQFIKDFEAMQK